MSFGAIKPNGGNGGKGFINPIEQAVIFSKSKLIRTLTQASDSLTTGTFIAGVRFTGHTTARETIFYAGNALASGNILLIERVNNQIRVGLDGALTSAVGTLGAFRDIEHFRLRVELDTTNADVNQRVRIFINNVRADVSGTQPLQNHAINQAIGDTQEIGAVTNLFPLDNTILSDVHWYDGVIVSDDTAEFPFGDHTITYAKPPSLSDHGTNGYRLTFANSADFGEDNSSSNNDFSATGFSPTDQVTDVPGNPYPVLSEIDKGPSVTLSDGGLHAALSGDDRVRATIPIPDSGAFAMKAIAGASTKCSLGVHNEDYKVNSSTSDSAQEGINYHGNGQVHIDGVLQGTFVSYVTNDVIEICVADGFVWFVKNGVSIQGDHLTKTGGFALPTGHTYWFTMCTSSGSAGAVWDVDFGQRGYLPPSGYDVLKSSNLPTPLYHGRDKFDVSLSVGTGAPRDIPTSFDEIGLVWGKARSSAYSHRLEDRLRGAGKGLFSNTTAAEDVRLDSITSFNSGSFSLGNDVGSGYNENGVSYAYWIFGNDGTEVTNNDGTIPSQVITDSSGYMSIVRYTGSGSGVDTIGHGLGREPELVITKSIDGVYNWAAAVVVDGLKYDPLYLDLNNGVGTSDRYGSLLTNTVELTNQTQVNRAGDDYISYLFSSVVGLSKVGKYTGIGSADGEFVECGFKPRWVLIKRTNSTAGWLILDSERNPDNPVDSYLFPNEATAEGTTSTVATDFTSTGFKPRGVSNNHNTNGSTYIYLAIADVAGGGNLPAVLGN